MRSFINTTGIYVTLVSIGKTRCALCLLYVIIYRGAFSYHLTLIYTETGFDVFDQPLSLQP